MLTDAPTPFLGTPLVPLKLLDSMVVSPGQGQGGTHEFHRRSVTFVVSVNAVVSNNTYHLETLISISHAGGHSWAGSDQGTQLRYYVLEMYDPHL